MKDLRFAVPSGTLMRRAVEILVSIGIPIPLKPGRDDYFGSADGIGFHRRDRETIPRLVAAGTFQAGITGSDLVVNSGVAEADIKVVIDLPFSRATNGGTRWVLAAANEPSSRKIRIGSERLGLAQHCLGEFLDAGAELVKLYGTEESAVGDNLCDAVFVVTETGRSIKAHRLRIIRDKLFLSTPQLIVNPGINADALAKVEEIGLAMRAVLDAELMVTVTFDLPRVAVSGLKLPAAVSPTVNETQDPDWVAGQVLIARRQLGHVMRQLNLAGARGVFTQDVQAYMKGGARL